jgi:hypothetical protein
VNCKLRAHHPVATIRIRTSVKQHFAADGIPVASGIVKGCPPDVFDIHLVEVPIIAYPCFSDPWDHCNNSRSQFLRRHYSETHGIENERSVGMKIK